jgi:hypothetical protein
MARCVICDGILQAYAKLVEEKGGSVEKSGLLKIQREHDENAHAAAAANRQPSSGDRRAA